MRHCMSAEYGCSASDCTCPCSPCKHIRVMAAAEEKARTQSPCLFHEWVRVNGDEVLTSAPPKVWCRCRLCGTCKPLLYYEDPVRDGLRSRIAELEAEANDRTTLDKKTLERLVDEQALRIAALEAENSELKVRDSNVTFHSRNVMAVNQDLKEKLAALEGKAR